MQFQLKRLILSLTLGLFILTAYAQENSNPEKQVSTVLLQTDHSWDGVKYESYPAGQPELTVLKINIPPHTALPWHTHPMPNAAYVVSGTLHVESKDGKHKTTLKAGDVLPEMVGSEHRGYTEDEAVQLIVFYAGVKDMPTAQKAQ
jgi:quercetin dioxygenase-like cupin family protein